MMEPDPHLAEVLKEIVATHKPEVAGDEWRAVLPSLVARINAIAATALETGATASANAPIATAAPSAASATTDTPSHFANPKSVLEQISVKSQKMCSRLESEFPRTPPFTVVRLAELVLSPEKSGYPLTSPPNILKFFNALSRLLCVSSTISDFPPVRFLPVDPSGPIAERLIVSSQQRLNGASQLADLRIHLMEIPWLREQAPRANGHAEPVADNDEATECSSSPTLHNAVSSPSAPVLDEVRSPTKLPAQRRRHHAGDSQDDATKRPRTNTPDQNQDAHPPMGDDNHTASINLGAESIFEESDRNEVCSTG
ncbi:hypothetical protein ABC855_g1570 [[Candida] zeylanoides]